MNVSSQLAGEKLDAKLLQEADAIGFYALKGHRNVGGIRASVDNPMLLTEVEKLASFMEEFERKNN